MCNLSNFIESTAGTKDKGLSTSVGDEGGFAPSINTNEEALELIVKAIEKSKLIPGKDMAICLDVAANELFKKNKYRSSRADENQPNRLKSSRDHLN